MMLNLQHHPWTPTCYAMALLCLLSLTHCSKPTATPPKAIDGTQVQMDFERKKGFFTAPFPSEDLRNEDGTPNLSKFPNPEEVDFVKNLLTILQRDNKGFSNSAGIYFKLTAPLAEKQLPTPEKSLKTDSPISLIDVDPSSPQLGKRHPINTKFETDGGPFGTQNQLSLLPYQGRPLRSNNLYAAVLSRTLKDSNQSTLGLSLSMAQLLANQRPPGLDEKSFVLYKEAISQLTANGVKPETIAGLAVFRTGNPTETFQQFVTHLHTQPLPALEAPFKWIETFPQFCVFQSHLKFPVFQTGKPPFTEGGGGQWQRNAQHIPTEQTKERARVFVTLPRTTMPKEGFPVVAFIRTGGGGDRPLIDRGVRAKAGGDAIKPGTGPALQFAQAGFAGISIDGPHGGIRNVSGGDEQFLIFNITNPVAMRDNIRQSALELTLIPALLAKFTISSKDCPDLKAPQDNTTFNTEKIALMGHSMGATIAPLTLFGQPLFKAAILSGAGGSWIENIIYKKRPLDVRPIAEGMLKYPAMGRTLHSHDPALTLLQWAGEPADPPLYSQQLIHDTKTPRHLLMLQGIVDSYIMPPIANALSLALGLDLAGPALDSEDPRLKNLQPLAPLLPLFGRKITPLPVKGNIQTNGIPITAVVIQHKQGPVEDGHEVVFQTEAPKLQYRCFLESFAKELPHIPKPGKENDPCPP